MKLGFETLDRFPICVILVWYPLGVCRILYLHKCVGIGYVHDLPLSPTVHLGEEPQWVRGVANCKWTSGLTLSIGNSIIYVSYVVEVIWTLTTTYVACANTLCLSTYEFTLFAPKTPKTEKGHHGWLATRSTEGAVLQVKLVLGSPKVPIRTMRWLNVWVDGVV